MGSPSEATGGLVRIGEALERELAEWDAMKRARAPLAVAESSTATPEPAPVIRGPWPDALGIEHFDVVSASRRMDHGHVVASTLRPRVPLAPCGGCENGYVRTQDEHGYWRVKTCGCQKARELVERFDAADLPGDTATKRWLERGRFDWAAPHVARAEVHVRAPDGAVAREPLRSYAERFCRSFRPGQRSLIIGGPMGTGKTHLVVGLQWAAMLLGFRTRFAEWLDYLERLKSTFDSPGKTAADVRAVYLRAPLLVVDDLARGVGREWGAEEFAKLLPRLKDPDTTTLITTNYWPDGIPVPGGQRVEALSSRVGSRSMDRLAEACDLAVIVGESQRTAQLNMGAAGAR